MLANQARRNGQNSTLAIRRRPIAEPHLAQLQRVALPHSISSDGQVADGIPECQHALASTLPEDAQRKCEMLARAKWMARIEQSFRCRVFDSLKSERLF